MLMQGSPATVAEEARHLRLVHGVDHGGRRAGAPQAVADIGDLAGGRAFAAELARYHDTEKALLARGSECLLRKAGLLVDRAGVTSRDARHDLGSGCEPRCIVAGVIRGTVPPRFRPHGE